MANIAVIGCGPKAIAIAAKAHVLAQSNRYLNKVQVTIFERDRPAAAWRGASGYTDGEQPLCTLAERDLGFPYSDTAFLREISERMFADFSWHAYAVAAGLGRARYEQWVLRGRNPPAHADFADYLEFALRRSGANVEQREVVVLDHDPSQAKWKVRSSDAPGSWRDDYFDAVVVTGPGPARQHKLSLDGGPAIVASQAPFRIPQNIFDGVTFWQQLPFVEAMLHATPRGDRKVVIIGAGGTAAAIAHWFVRRGIDASVSIVGKQATLYTRAPGYFEDRLFTDEDAWRELSDDSRREFISRLTSGVVWDYVLRNLNETDIEYDCAEFDSFDIRTVQGAPDEVRAVTLPEPGGAPLYRSGTVFVDARGFNRWDFARLLQHSTAAQLGNMDEVEAGINSGLMVDATSLPVPFPAGLHVPMLASIQGPAAPNLMGLGWVADRILSPYVQNQAPISILYGSMPGTP
ncbi:hypothetical protein P0D75_30600 [Paraburkholderia sediminicola]|uniref:hypothetical protein n=1 Tax=Paraburkholderia sediminicola TaxID=458836 RepID=UPI0038BA3F10